MIRARAWSDDHKVEVEFDAEPYLRQASVKEINALRNCSWGGHYPADNVARFMSETDAGLRRLFSYLDIVEDQGFECYIDEEEAEAFLLERGSY